MSAQRSWMRQAFPAMVAVAAIIVAVTVLVASCSGYTAQREVVATVTGKDRVCSGSGDGMSCKYLVFTDEGTFQVSDSLLIGRFDSSDVYGRFREDRTYRFDVYGWRSPFLSMYPNVASEPVEVER